MQKLQLMNYNIQVNMAQKMYFTVMALTVVYANEK